mmetsp:Transcript_10995/g.16759  ORF Transcript_10995/g.16759 Transcript_10995/m.16759 type:complete len:91 (+) Transcript_10995:76-348(+)
MGGKDKVLHQESPILLECYLLEVDIVQKAIQQVFQALSTPEKRLHPDSHMILLLRANRCLMRLLMVEYKMQYEDTYEDGCGFLLLLTCRS